jgi:hypothetical protein
MFSYRHNFPILELYFGLFACVHLYKISSVFNIQENMVGSETFNTYIHISGRLQFVGPGTKQVELVTLSV